MESQPQNHEFRINPVNFHSCIFNCEIIQYVSVKQPHIIFFFFKIWSKKMDKYSILYRLKNPNLPIYRFHHLCYLAILLMDLLSKIEVHVIIKQEGPRALDRSPES